MVINYNRIGLRKDGGKKRFEEGKRD